MIGTGLEHEGGRCVAHRAGVGVGSSGAAAHGLLVCQASVEGSDLLRAAELWLTSVRKRHLISGLKVAVVFDQVLSIAQALMCMVSILYIDVVRVGTFQYLMIDHPLLGLLALVRVQLVEVANLLSLRSLVDERVLARVPFRSGLLSIREPALELPWSQGILVVPHVQKRLVVASCGHVVACEPAISLDQVLPRDVGMFGQVRLANDHVVRRGPLKNLPLAFDGDVAIFESVSLLGQLCPGEVGARLIGRCSFSIFGHVLHF